MCPYTGTGCYKTRKSSSQIAIGTCVVDHEGPIVICPRRMLHGRRVFDDCVPLLREHRADYDLHVVPEVPIEGGNVDYFLVSASRGHVRDYCAIELQTLDTTGTVWPARQRLAASLGVRVPPSDLAASGTFGMNWKMTAKTILVQLHHKVDALEAVGKPLVLVVQDRLLGYMRETFSFDHIRGMRAHDPLHLHSYRLDLGARSSHLELVERLSTTAAGIEKALARRATTAAPTKDLAERLQDRLSPQTRLAAGRHAR